MKIVRMLSGIGIAAVFAAGTALAEQAPAFSLKSLDGKTVSLAALKGKVVFVDFWASWCPPCRRSIPAVEALYEKFAGDPRVVVLGINVENDPDMVRGFAQKNGMKYTVLNDDGAAGRAYRVSGIPAFFIIDAQGNIAKRYVGFRPDMESEWADTVGRLAAQAAPAKPAAKQGK